MLCDSSTSYNLRTKAVGSAASAAAAATAVVVGTRVAVAETAANVDSNNSNNAANNPYHEMPTTPTLTITGCSNDLTSLADQHAMYLTTTITPSSSSSTSNNSKHINNNLHSSSSDSTSNITANNNSNNSSNMPMVSSISSKRGGGGSSGPKTNRAHPNIQHHTPIHPHSKYSRQRNASISSNSISESKTTGSISTTTTTINTTITTSGDHESSANKSEFLSYNFGDDDDDDDDEDYDDDDDDLTSLMDCDIIQYRFLNQIDLASCSESKINEMIEDLNKEMVKLQGLIDQLNNRVLSDDANRAKPPPEYLDVYNNFTVNIHNIQNEKQILEERLAELKQARETAAAAAAAANTTSTLSSPSMDEDEAPGEVISFSNLNHRRLSTNSSTQQQQQQQNEDEYMTTGNNNSYSNSRATSQNGSRNNSSHNINQSVSMSSIVCNSPLLPTALNANGNIPYFNYDSGAKSPHLTKKSHNSSTSSNFKSSSGNLNTKHPTSLNTVNGGFGGVGAFGTISTNKRAFQSSSKPSTPTLPISNMLSTTTKPTISYNGNTMYPTSSMSTSLTTSPATTPTTIKASVSPPRDIHMNKKHSISGVSNIGGGHHYSQSISLTTSSSSLTLPLNNLLLYQMPNNNSLGIDNNNNNNSLLVSGGPPLGNSRSYGDINDAVQTPSGTSQSNGERVSPSGSVATTPTFKTPFLRVIIGYSTAVIEKKPIPLKDALSSKLKSRNLEIDKCIAFYQDTNIKLDWSIEVNRITAEIIEVAEVGDTIRHNFEKKTFTIRACDSCKKHFLLNVYACTKCDYIMCQKNECRERTEKVVCAPRKGSMSSSYTAPSGGAGATGAGGSFGGGGAGGITSNSNVSQQILPVNQLKVMSYPSSRDRSRSENEINAEKLINETSHNNRLVPSTTSNFDKSTDSGVGGSMSSKKNIDSVSGSVNEVSGSVSKIYGNSTTSGGGSNVGSTVGPLISEKPEVIMRPLDHRKSLDQRIPSRRDSFNSWEIPFTQIKIDTNSKVGSGSFGIVHKGWDYYQEEVAVKFLNVQHPSLSQASAFRNEVAILKAARHENILLFIGCILRPYMAIVTEWCPGSSLYRHIHVQEEERWEMPEIVNIARQISIGMEYLHARDILHRDLKSNNIFLVPKAVNANMPMRRRHHHRNFKKSKAENNLDDFLSHEVDTNKWIVKIGDFGLATVKSTWVQNAPKSNQPTGSILWMAPEVITQKVPDPYTAKSDVYSYAVVLYELVTNSLPYAGKEQNMILYQVGAGRLRPNADEARADTPKELKELISICSQYDRDKRLEFVGVNKYLKEVKLVKQKKIERAQSVPNVSFSPESSVFDIGSSIYEDEVYPISPRMHDLIYESYEEQAAEQSSSPSSPPPPSQTAAASAHDVKPTKSNSSDDVDNREQ